MKVFINSYQPKIHPSSHKHKEGNKGGEKTNARTENYFSSHRSSHYSNEARCIIKYQLTRNRIHVVYCDRRVKDRDKISTKRVEEIYMKGVEE